MYRVVAPLAVLAMTAAVPASAQDAATAQPAEKPVKEKKVCKSETGTGSIMPKRTCRTKAEWAALTEQSKGNLERSQKVSGGTGMVGVNGGQ